MSARAGCTAPGCSADKRIEQPGLAAEGRRTRDPLQRAHAGRGGRGDVPPRLPFWGGRVFVSNRYGPVGCIVPTLIAPPSHQVAPDSMHGVRTKPTTTAHAAEVPRNDLQACAKQRPPDHCTILVELERHDDYRLVRFNFESPAVRKQVDGIFAETLELG